MKLYEMVLDDYLKLLASDAPAPGGGSASALCGAQGAGLVAMVARLTLSKEKFAEFHPVCEKVADQAAAISQKLTEQIELDSAAYDGLAQSFRLPKGTDEEKAARKEAIRAATRHAAQVPLDTMKLCVEGLETAKNLLGSYNTNCASDIGCAAGELLAGVKGARMNVMINVTGSALEEEFMSECELVYSCAEKLAAEVEENIIQTING